MNAQNATEEYLLLIRCTHWNQGLSPAELQRVIQGATPMMNAT